MATTTVSSFGALLTTPEAAKTASYTVLAGDVGTLFTNTGAVGAITFTLPAIAAGYAYKFKVVADQTVTVASNEGSNVVVVNNASASNLIFQTAGDRIGGTIYVYTNAAGTKWHVDKLCSNALTIS